MSDTATGVLKITARRDGELRDPARSFRRGPADARVPGALIRRHRLPEGAEVAGPVQRGRHGPELHAVTAVCGLAPDVFAARTPFDKLTPIDPCDRLHLSKSDDMAMRLVDLLAPIGRGTRGLIVSPPKAGKTTILMAMAKTMRAAEPEAHIIALLIDERPEEVTHFRRGVDVQVLASSKDESPESHIELAEMTLAYVRTLLECGRHVIVLVDSLTRMGRAFNVRGSGTGRTMSGGLEAGVLEVPRRFFGLARNVENGGSVTIIATVLVDTGSRMDELIFQEFKGTGNSEVVLSRSLAEARIFPAIDLPASGTRKEELLYGREELSRVSAIRSALAGRKPDNAMRALLKAMDPYPTNEAFLASIPGE
ncbi:MAG: transcription termination factor Rho [Candidatus Eisenbacteria bacterium]|uniref:Transcription termination factor Rho n=1 Tax=Eiseniibacteriota bacterium TaxID=2212470 RepID=A0A937X9Y3_UNCEI|nr:transcription termination factor Rho [Candidatus Eisenbacteria bacterium]